MNNIKFNKCIGFLLVLFFAASFAVIADENTKESDTASGKMLLQKNNWEPTAYSALTKLIQNYGVNSPDYNPEKPPYAVFDWDNTSIINDIEENTLLYQLENLDFKMTPDKLNEVIRKDIPKKDFAVKNVAGKSINIDLIAQDIISDYEYIYSHYKEMKGDESLDKLKESVQYKDFVVKMRFLYEAIGETFSPDVSYPWVIYLFTGMTKDEVQELSKESIEYWTKQPLKKITLTSPEELPGKAGVVSLTCFTGIREIKEMQNLYNTLMNNGIDVYICSASFVDVIKTFASESEFGYNVPENHILAMELERDKDGKIIDEYRKGYDQTQNKGKTKNINRFLVSKYGYGPILVGGDSGGDYAMLTDFKNTKLGIIINRYKGGPIGELCKQAMETKGKPIAKYLLQGRDENKGEFVPTSESVLIKDDKKNT